METRHGLSVLQSVQTEGESESLGQLLDAVELLAVSIDPAMILLQLFELVDEGLDHRLGTVGLVVLSGLVQSVLKTTNDQFRRKFTNPLTLMMSP